MGELSQDARALAGCLWGTAMGSKMKLTYRRGEPSIHPRTLAALNELVSAGVIAREVGLKSSMSVTYAPVPGQDCRRFARDRKHGKDIILSAIPDQARDEAVAAEREACARLVETWVTEHELNSQIARNIGRNMAAAIRARSAPAPRQRRTRQSQ